MSLVVFTAILSWRLLGLSTQWHEYLIYRAGGGASGALNMWYDADIDGVMAQPNDDQFHLENFCNEAGIGPCCRRFQSLCLDLRQLVGGLLTCFHYILLRGRLYYVVKRLTPQNIVIGGAVGAFPPIIGLLL